MKKEIKIVLFAVVVLVLAFVVGLIIKNNSNQVATSVDSIKNGTKSFCDIGECETEGNYKTTKNKDPNVEERQKTMEADVVTNLSRTANENLTQSTSSGVTIPVVFHVVWNLPEQNISDAQLNSQIDVLNQDFNAQNLDVSTVPAPFAGLVGNSGIKFVLAKRDPQGNPTTGIVRKYSTVPSFSSDGSVCFNSLGGDDAWPHDQYLNIWVTNKTGAAGVSAYPWSGSPASDGIIIGYNWVGTTGYFPYNYDYQKGRTLTHEVGHWFGLIHIWGDAICGDDLVSDTPTQYSANGASPTFPHVTNCLGNAPNGDMFMDYMDYTYDATRVMFSAGQVTRMLGYLNTTRASLLTSLGAIPPSGADTTPPTVSLTAPANGAIIYGTASTISANATDNVAVSKVDFYQGATLLGTDTTSPYSIYWNTTTIANGNYNMLAKATDASNNSATSSMVSVTVANAVKTIPPSVVITSPSSLPKNGSARFTATATDASGISTIKLSINNVLKQTCANVTTCTYSWPMKGLQGGSYTLSAVAVNKSGISGSSSKTVTK